MNILKVIAAIVGVLSPFFFPWPYALLLSFLIALFVPPTFLIVGVLLDLLYFGGSRFPYFFLIGVGGAAIAYVVHEFIKTRIMA